MFQKILMIYLLFFDSNTIYSDRKKIGTQDIVLKVIILSLKNKKKCLVIANVDVGTLKFQELKLLLLVQKKHN